ncbi:MAG: hypothetical protein NTW19_08885 [Planctomycetota bacterium]|nr:hypothetical protein [Planctomycetota bacterium]
MKRSIRRVLSIALGLTLGWLAAGYLPGSPGVSSPSLAQDAGHAPGHDHAKAGSGDSVPGVASDVSVVETGSNAATQAASDATPAAAPGEAVHEHDDDEHTGPAPAIRNLPRTGMSQGRLAAETLRPVAASDLNWYGKLLLGIAGLFVLALVVGWLALVFRSTPTNDQVDPHKPHA